MSWLEKATELVSRKWFRKGWLGFIIVFFLIFIILPTVFVLSYVFTNWSDIQNHVLNDPAAMSAIWAAIGNSFEIAAIVTLIDFLVGLPMAWILVRKKFRGKQLLDTFIDMPLVVPTAALGFSAVIFWGVTVPTVPYHWGLELVTSPFLLVILLHILFSYPYMVRSLSAILEEIDQTYETAGRTLGASKLTAVRTITLPLFRAGLVTGVILCFARSLSETGGTFLALNTLAGTDGFNTAPTLIQYLKSIPNSQPVLAFISILLIVLALVLLVVVAFVIKKVHLPIRKVWPRPEKILSRGLAPKLKDFTSIAFLIFIVLIPTFWIFTFVVTAPSTATDWSAFLTSLAFSFAVAGIITVVDLVVGVPLALYIARGRGKRLPEILDVLVNVPLIVPTVALGISLAMFWNPTGKTSPEIGFILVVLAHLAFTFPLMVRNVTGAVEETDPAFEETARTLGAKPIQAFRRVLYPMISSSILAGAIMAFTRSLGETGATLAVYKGAITAPIYIVNLIVKDHNYYSAAVACIVLIAISFVFMLALRRITRKRQEES